MAVRMGIESISATMDMGRDIDIQQVHAAFGDGKKHRMKNGGLSYRIRKPDVTVELYPSGKINLVGLMTMGDVESAKKAVLSDLESAGIVPSAPPEPKIYNMVASGDLGTALDLPGLYLELGPAKAEYEPEQFSGLIYRMDDPKVTVLIFNSGKIVCTGSPNPNDLMRAAETVSDLLLGSGRLRWPVAPVRIRGFHAQSAEHAFLFRLYVGDAEPAVYPIALDRRRYGDGVQIVDLLR